MRTLGNVLSGKNQVVTTIEPGDAGATPLIRSRLNSDGFDILSNEDDEEEKKDEQEMQPMRPEPAPRLRQ